MSKLAPTAQRIAIAIASILLIAGCASGGGSAPETAAAAAAAPDTDLATPAERSGYTATTPFDTVVAYLQKLVRYASIDSTAGRNNRKGIPSLYVGIAGITTEKRALPYVVLARPMVRSGREAHASGRPVVYIEANIHAGEVEGKEAMLALIRDLGVRGAPGAASVLDSIVIVVVPIYNADGNERFAPQAVNRAEQNGPEQVGERANAQHLDLNRDFVKAEAPETRTTLAMFRDWDPDVFVDLHTTDGSFHGYALTYAPSLNPGALFTGPYTRDSLLPVLRQRMRERHHFEIFDYGNFEPARTPGPDTARHSWQTYDGRPRFGTNYVGLRNRIAILSEAYSHDPFARRVASTYAFVREILSVVAERRAQILRLTASADSTVVDWGTHPGGGAAIPLTEVFAPSRGNEPVLVEDLERVAGPGGDSALTEPGVPRGQRRTGRIHLVPMPVIDRFAPVLTDRLPRAYLVPAKDTAVIRLLRLHGIEMRSLRADTSVTAAEQFHIDSVQFATTVFEGHHEASVTGRWQAAPGDLTIPAGTQFVPGAQRLGVVAMYLLDPRSDDGFGTWNLFDRELAPGREYPVVRLVGKP
jgi:hypothetical protein